MKDAFYFSHDANARHDPDILSMRSVYGSEGYGWYWMIIEMLREQENYKIKLTQYVWNALAMQLQCDADAVHRFVQDCINEFNLLRSDGEYFWSDSLIKRMKNKDEKSEKARKAAEARWKKSHNDGEQEDQEQTQSESNADAMQTQCERNALKKRREKKKENNIYDDQFEQFWTVYPRKVGKKRAYTKWKARLKNDSPSNLIKAAENYAKQCELNQTETRFVKHPSTFLSDKEDYKDYLEETSVVSLEEQRKKKDELIHAMTVERNRWVDKHGHIDGFEDHWNRIKAKYGG